MNIFRSLSLALLLLFPLHVFGQNSKKHPETVEQTESKKQKTELSDVAWIAGQWRGNAMGGEFEESWNPPMGGSMMGMFKFVKDNEIGFYELMTIVEEGDSLMLRLKHFDKKLNGWEEKDKSIEFPFVSHSEKETVFDGLKFVRVDNFKMHIIVKINKDEGEIEEMKFECKRVVQPNRDPSNGTDNK
ncbi:MAG: DUF6265 family protein [Mariniblastus sp.]